MPELLFATPHGSKLYGTAHPGSDNDSFEVYSNRIGRTKARNSKQTIKGSEDVLKTDLSTFVLYAKLGVPQYLEAMYSRLATTDVLGEEFRYSFRPDLWETIHKYRRTMTAFYERGEEEDNDKFRRHAWRLLFNMNAIERGRAFNPTLSKLEIFWIEDNIKTNPLDSYDA